MISVSGSDDLSRLFRRELGPTIQAGLIAIAKQAEHIIAPYPVAPPHGTPWYERGYGWKYRRKDGRIRGRKTSETLGRRWTIMSDGRLRVQLRNLASYSGLVHDSERQIARHAATGWKTDQDIERELDGNAIVDALVDPIVKLLGG